VNRNLKLQISFADSAIPRTHTQPNIDLHQTIAWENERISISDVPLDERDIQLVRNVYCSPLSYRDSTGGRKRSKIGQGWDWVSTTHPYIAM
jgi:hypothetical protein